MKTISLLLILSSIFVSCGNDDEASVVLDANTTDKVMLLKLNFENYALEGGQELVFAETAGFTIVPEVDFFAVQDPDETPFGNVVLKYGELGETLFDADFTQNGTGQINVPENFNSADSFSVIEQEVEIPELTSFENIPLDFYLIAPQDVEDRYPLIWDAIDNLELVKEYRESNPEAKVYVFQYATSYEMAQSVSNWKWYVLLKN